MKLQVDFAHGDIVIKRAMNGWIATTGSEYDDEITVTSVYEDPEYGEYAESNSLLYLIREQFDSYIQTKKRGGIKLEVREKGYSYEEDEETEKEFMDYAASRASAPRPYCDVCGRLVDDYETELCGGLAGVVMCAGKMKKSCKGYI